MTTSCSPAPCPGHGRHKPAPPRQITALSRQTTSKRSHCAPCSDISAHQHQAAHHHAKPAIQRGGECHVRAEGQRRRVSSTRRTSKHFPSEAGRKGFRARCCLIFHKGG